MARVTVAKECLGFDCVEYLRLKDESCDYSDRSEEGKERRKKLSKEWLAMGDRFWKEISPKIEEANRELLKRHAAGECDLTGYFYSPNVADGSALYRVKKCKPLHLEWVPGLLDDYKLVPAHERGLRYEDIEADAKFSRFWRELCEKKKDGKAS